jgi:multidrug efflux pump subunit AcrA (membrane-fusion protein)
MKVLRAIVGWLTPVAILAAGVAAFAMLGRQPPPERKMAERPAAALVTTTEAVTETEGLSLELDGVVVPVREVTLAAEVPGRVQHKAEACKAGRFVSKGTPLFEIDPRDYELDVSRLERELAQAGLAIEEVDEEAAQNATAGELAQRQLELARREVRRLDTLKAGRIVTETEHDRAVREELAATATLTNLQGQARVLRKRRNRLEEAQSLAATMLERARLDLARTRVTAPTDGVVVEEHVEQDSFVSKGMALVTIEDTAAAEVRTSLQMDQVARVWRSAAASAAPGAAHDLPDAPATVVFTVGGHTYEWEGVLSRQEGRGLDEKTRTLACRVRIPAPTQVRALDRYGAPLQTLPPGAPRALLRGMFVQVRVHVASSHTLVSIPEEAVRPSGEVWVVRDGRLEIVRPRPVQVSRGRAVFESDTSGIEAGDRIVVSQLLHPRDGMEVAEAADAPAPAATAAALDDGDAT